MAIESGNWVKVSYTGKLKDGTVFDSSEGKEPITFEVGAGTVIKGFDQNVEGMEIGAEKEFTIPAAEAYGEESDKQQEEVPLSFFKDVEKVETGMSFIAQSPMGPLKVKVLSVDDKAEKATVAVNHPLAGEDLTFNIKVEHVLSDDEVKEFQEAQKQQYEEMMKQQAEGGAGCGCGPEGCDSEECGPECGPKDEVKGAESAEQPAQDKKE